jgi:hypothetical protein
LGSLLISLCCPAVRFNSCELVADALPVISGIVLACRYQAEHGQNYRTESKFSHVQPTPFFFYDVKNDIKFL